MVIGVNEISSEDAIGAKSLLKREATKFSGDLSKLGFQTVPLNIQKWKIPDSFVSSPIYEIDGLPSVNIWLDKCQDGQTWLFYCGVGADTREDIQKVIAACGFLSEIEIEFTDERWIEANGLFQLGMPLPIENAMLPIRDTHKDGPGTPDEEKLGCADGLYQHIAEPRGQFFARSLEFITSVLAAVQVQILRSDKRACRQAALDVQRRNEQLEAKTGTRNIFGRNPWVAGWALTRAGGTCECCNKAAPFVNLSGGHRRHLCRRARARIRAARRSRRPLRLCARQRGADAVVGHRQAL